VSNGWLGLDADTWGNLIAALTGVGAVGGGVLTLLYTSKQARDGQREDAEAARAAELRAQSRDAVVRILDETEQARADVRGDTLTRAQAHARRADHFRVIGSAALLVHDLKVRAALILATEAYRLGPMISYNPEWEPRHLEQRDREIVEAVRVLSAAFLRDDKHLVESSYEKLRGLWQSGSSAARLLHEAERTAAEPIRSTTPDESSTP
jgi:hypothetical protein